MININIKNLQQGMTVKNYKEMCKLLGEEISSGSSKQAQIKEWKRCFDFQREGHKYIIGEIYSKPLPKAPPKHSIYINTIEKLLIKELAQSPGYTLYLTKTRIFYLLGMINEKYLQNRMEITSGELIQYSPWEVSQFYVRTDHRLSQILFSALNSMQRRCLIDYNEKWVIVEPHSNCKINFNLVELDLSEIGSSDEDASVYSQGKLNDNDYLIHRFASNDEVQDILHFKQIVLKEMGIESVPFNKAEGFYKRVNTKLHKEYGWSRIYKKYEISFTKEFMESSMEIVYREIDNLNRKQPEYQAQLNNQIVKVLNDEVEKLVEKNKNKVLTDKNIYVDPTKNETLPIEKHEDVSHSEDIPGEKDSDKWGETKPFEYPVNYLETQSELIDLLVKIHAK